MSKTRPNNGKHARRRIRPYTTLRCPLAGNQVTWCRGLCVPFESRGVCGRLAPHAMKGRTQRAIAAHKTQAEDVEEAQ